MYSLTVVIAAAAAGAIAMGGVVWLFMTVSQLRAQIAELHLARQQPLPAAMQAWTENVKLDHRAQLLSVAALVKMSARDQLDALMRLSPEMVREVVETVAPQLFNRENIK